MAEGVFLTLIYFVIESYWIIILNNIDEGQLTVVDFRTVSDLPKNPFQDFKLHTYSTSLYTLTPTIWKSQFSAQSIKDVSC